MNAKDLDSALDRDVMIVLYNHKLDYKFGERMVMLAIVIGLVMVYAIVNGNALSPNFLALPAIVAMLGTLLKSFSERRICEVSANHPDELLTTESMSADSFARMVQKEREDARKADGIEALVDAIESVQRRRQEGNNVTYLQDKQSKLY